jgi:hypothetical protein
MDWSEFHKKGKALCPRKSWMRIDMGRHPSTPHDAFFEPLARA